MTLPGRRHSSSNIARMPLFCTRTNSRSNEWPSSPPQPATDISSLLSSLHGGLVQLPGALNTLVQWLSLVCKCRLCLAAELCKHQAPILGPRVNVHAGRLLLTGSQLISLSPHSNTSSFSQDTCVALGACSFTQLSATQYQHLFTNWQCYSFI